ncbi:MAG: hypothetical protein M3R17_08780 [Bacteroidota bacterium]|nr:hypothetical protein [Bacteroidota bacterium]
MNLLLGVLLLAHVSYAVYATEKLLKSNLFSKTLKLLHLFLIWSFPFLWGMLIVALMKKSPGTDQVKLDFDDVNPNAFRNERPY